MKGNMEAIRALPISEEAKEKILRIFTRDVVTLCESKAIPIICRRRSNRWS